MEYENIKKFENKLYLELKRYKHKLEATKKKYQSHLAEHGCNDIVIRNILKTQIIESKIEVMEDIIEEFMIIFRNEINK